MPFSAGTLRQHHAVVGDQQMAIGASDVNVCRLQTRAMMGGDGGKRTFAVNNAREDARCASWHVQGDQGVGQVGRQPGSETRQCFHAPCRGTDRHHSA